MSHTKRATEKFSDYFTIDEKHKDTLSFELDTEKVDKKLSRAGFFILLSGKPSLSSGEVLRVYHDRDVIEKNFEQFKNHLDFKRMRTHWNKTTEGKMFVGFIALILRPYMLRVIKGDPLTPLAKLQKTILSILGVPLAALRTAPS